MIQEIPYSLRVKHPNLSLREIRLIVRTFLKAKTYKVKDSHIIDFTIPYIGRVKSHGNKKVKRYRKTLIKDRRRKKKEYRKKILTPENVLF
jgi:type III secretory pathway component EscR